MIESTPARGRKAGRLAVSAATHVLRRSRPKRLAAALVTVAVSVTTLFWTDGASAQGLKYFRTDTAEFKESAKLGKQMFEAYQCALCHATKEGEPLTEDIIAPNLILAKERLRPEWMLQWLIDPQTLQPGTKMPNFFSFNEDDDYNLIYGDPDAHVQYKIIVAIRDYLMVLGTEMEKELTEEEVAQN